MAETKTLSIRLPISIYRKATDMAKARHQSLNRLIQDGLQSIEIHEREKRLYNDFTTIAELGREEIELDFAFKTQLEVIAQ